MRRQKTEGQLSLSLDRSDLFDLHVNHFPAIVLVVFIRKSISKAY